MASLRGLFASRGTVKKSTTSSSTLKTNPKLEKRFRAMFPHLPPHEMTQAASQKTFDCLLTQQGSEPMTLLGELAFSEYHLLFAGKQLQLTSKRTLAVATKTRAINYRDILEISKDTHGVLYRENIILKLPGDTLLTLSFLRYRDMVHEDLIIKCSLSLLPASLPVDDKPVVLETIFESPNATPNHTPIDIKPTVTTTPSSTPKLQATSPPPVLPPPARPSIDSVEPRRTSFEPLSSHPLFEATFPVPVPEVLNLIFTNPTTATSESPRRSVSSRLRLSPRRSQEPTSPLSRRTTFNLSLAHMRPFSVTGGSTDVKSHTQRLSTELMCQEEHMILKNRKGGYRVDTYTTLQSATSGRNFVAISQFILDPTPSGGCHLVVRGHQPPSHSKLACPTEWARAVIRTRIPTKLLKMVNKGDSRSCPQLPSSPPSTSRNSHCPVVYTEGAVPPVPRKRPTISPAPQNQEIVAAPSSPQYKPITPFLCLLLLITVALAYLQTAALDSIEAKLTSTNLS